MFYPSVAPVHREAPQPLSDREIEVRKRYLDRAAADFDSRLRASIHFIDLDIRDDPEAVRPAWGYRAFDGKKSYAHVVEAFVAAQRRLLILGQPGSGKSTALVHLAKHLLRDAAQDADAPLPFIVNLSKFQLVAPDSEPRLLRRKGKGESERPDTRFEDWFAGELATFPGLSRNLARKWIRQGRIAALLDGLDEFNDDHRAGLVRLLNTTLLRDYPGMTVVICSRINEYAVLRSEEETTLQLSGGVELQPLTRDQIDEYLKARNATGLLAALSSDKALQELARTPLTLAMLVTAYGRSAPGNLAVAGGLSQRRHELFHLYVGRMLQRMARKEKLGIPLDDLRMNDVPESEYRYRPEQVQRWLGWLAVILSVAMKTTFSAGGVYSLLNVHGKANRQSTYFCAVYVSIACLMSIMLTVAGLTFVPLRLVEWGHVFSILIGASLALLLINMVPETWKFLSIPAGILAAAVIFYDIGLVATVLATKIPVGISPMPMSVIAVAVLVTFCLSLQIIINRSNGKSVMYRMWACCLSGLLLAAVFHEIPVGGHLGFLGSQWLQMVAAGAGVLVGNMLTEEGRLFQRIGMLGVTTFIGALLVGMTWLVGTIDPTKTMLAAAANSVLILSVSEIPTGAALLAGLMVFLAGGGLLGGASGAVLGGGIYGALSTAITATDGAEHISPNGRSLIDRFVAWLLRLFERLILSPVFWLAAAIATRAPWRSHRFLLFSRDAFLLKNNGAEFEFVHRLLRDYFALQELLPAIDTPDRTARLAVIRSLGYQGESALDVLSDLSSATEVDVRAVAVTALSHIASPIVAKILEQRVSDRAPGVRYALIRAAVKLSYDDFRHISDSIQPLGDGSEVDVLLEFAGSLGTQHSAEALLEQLGLSAKDPLIARLGDRSPKVREMALRTLAKLRDPKVADAVLALYASEKNESVRIQAIRALANQGDPRGLSAVLARLKKKIASDERVEIVEVLGQWKGDEAIETLRRLLSDRDERVRVAAVKSLGYRGSDAVDLLLTQLNDSNPQLRRGAIRSLRWVDDPNIIGKLLPMLQDPVVQVRLAVIDEVQWLRGAREIEVVEPLLAKLDDADLEVRARAAAALKHFNDPRAVEPLLRKLDDPDVKMRVAAAESLEKLGGAAAVEPLLQKLADPELEVRIAAVKSLGKLCDTRAVEPLLRKLDDPDVKMRVAAAASLGKLGDISAVEGILRKLADPELEVRSEVVESLGQLGDSRAIEPLLSLLEDENEELSVRAGSSIALLGDARGHAALHRFLQDPSRRKRRLGVQYLARNCDWQDRYVLGASYGKWIDPQEPISVALVAARAQEHKYLSEEEIRKRFRKLKDDFDLTLEF